MNLAYNIRYHLLSFLEVYDSTDPIAKSELLASIWKEIKISGEISYSDEIFQYLKDCLLWETLGLYTLIAGNIK